MNYKKFLFVFIIISIIYYILSNYVFINGGGGGNATTPPSTSPPPSVDPFLSGVTSLTAGFSNTDTPLPTNSPAPPTSPGPQQCNINDLTIIIDNTKLNKKDNPEYFFGGSLSGYYVNVYDSDGNFYGPKDIVMNAVDKNKNKNLVNTFCIRNGGYLYVSEFSSTSPSFNNNALKISYNYLNSLITKYKYSSYILANAIDYSNYSDYFAGSLIDKTIPQ